MLLLEHRVRRTGRARYAVLEVVGREPGALYVVSGYGRHAQWFRNVRVDPRVRVWTGALRAAPARAVELPAAETGQRLTGYRDRHPWVARLLSTALAIPELSSPGELPTDIADRLALLRLEPDPTADQRG